MTEWWQWALTIFGGLIVFAFGSGFLTIAFKTLEAFNTMRDDIGGIRTELEVLATKMQASLDAGEARFDGLEKRIDRWSEKIRDFEDRIGHHKSGR